MNQKYSVPAFTFILFFAPFISTSAFEQDPFQIELDLAQFRYKSDTTYLEIYYSYAESQLIYSRNEGGNFEGAMLMNVSISDPRDDSLIVNRWWRVPHVVSDTANLVRGKRFVGVAGLIIPQGKYVLTIKTSDERDSLRKHLRSYDILEKSFHTDNVSLSDIQLCTSIKRIPRDPNNIFYKNSFEAIPNPSGIYGVGMPVVFYYVEAYNLISGVHGETYYTNVSVRDSDDRELVTRTLSKQRLHESSVEVGTINVNTYRSGEYRLVVALIDSSTGGRVDTEKSFLVYNPRKSDSVVKERVADHTSSEYATLSAEELDREFAVTGYIASRSEKSQYKKLQTLRARREFLFNFWKGRDPQPETPRNELKLEYMQRVKYADDHFGSGYKAGWNTDRGRVLLLYGEPNEYERHTHEMGTKPYEVWYFDTLQGGVQFVFVDLLGYQEYELVHSTHRDELQDYYWRSLLSR